MNTLRRIPYWAAIALLIYMPFHIFLSQSLSTVTGGLEVWKLGKDMVIAIVALFTICLVWQQRLGGRAFNLLVGLSALYFGLHLLLWASNPDIYQRSAILGTIYNARLPALLVIGYGAALLLQAKFVFSSILKIVLVVSTVVALLGVIQYFLPKDLLTHVGYSFERGARPAFFIDDNPDLPRIMSTLREPNGLGAYLILPIAALTWLGLRYKDRRRRLQIAALGVLHMTALYLTFSRSAWLGAALAVALVAWWSQRDQITNYVKRHWSIMVGLLILLAGTTFLVRDTYFFQHYIIHADPEEQVADLDSNDYHALLIRKGLEGIAERPLGHGPGTAGLASLQNPNESQLTENYYVQVGYEVGLLGLLVFIALNVWVYIRIRRRADYVAVILLSSFWAYVLTNMLLHTWSNETVATQWWILAGMALAASTATRTLGYNKKQ